MAAHSFSNDPAYLAALEAAARTSVLAAASNLPHRPAGTGPAPAAPPPPAAAHHHPTPVSADTAGHRARAPYSCAAAAAAAAAAATAPASSTPAQLLQPAGGSAPAASSAKRAAAAAAAAAGSATAATTASVQPARTNSTPSVGGNGSGSSSKAAGKQQQVLQLGRYPEHLGQEDLQRGFKRFELQRGKLRINPGDRREGYVTLPGLAQDVLVRGDLAQNRAVEGDEVALRILPADQWYVVHKLAAKRAAAAAGQPAPEGQPPAPAAGASSGEPWLPAASAEAVNAHICRILAARPELRVTAKVVAIVAPSPKRDRLVGVLQRGDAARCPDPSGAGPALFLLPLDARLPNCVVRSTDVKGLPEALVQEAEQAGAQTRTLMSARICEWSSAHAHPAVALRHSLGQAGEIEPETAAILEMEGIREEEFGPEVLACLPDTPWSISDQELAKRRDFRSTRVFSIDPPTAKDLDDALSIEPLQGGGWRVGVHIADVAHFIPPFSALDKEAGMRATSTYMVQRVVPMLPPLLCEQLCSLNPGVERLSFSVVWDMDAQGNIQLEWFGRSVICSCAKLTYPVVQTMIDGTFDAAACPVQLHGGATWEEVVSDSLRLWRIASTLRAARFAGGALRLDNVRLFFKLDKDGNPTAAAPYVQREANQLVEEFMLLANMSVARAISDTFKERAMLRRHPPPNQGKLKDFQEAAMAAGVSINVNSAAELQAGLQALRQSVAPGGGDGSADPGLAKRRRLVEVVVMLATRPQQLAQYFSTGEISAESCWRHYALAVGAYTHFTSPIRRYPDVVVHRLLAAALELRADPSLALEEVAARHRLLDTRLCGMVAEHCNERRLAARDAQDDSLHLYLCVMLRRHPAATHAVLTGVNGDKFVTAYVPEFGVEVRINMMDIGVPHAASWDDGAKVLLLAKSQEAGSGSGTNGGAAGMPASGSSGDGGGRRAGGGGRGGGFGRGGQQQQQQRGGGSSRAEAETDCPDLAAWVSALPLPLNVSPGVAAVGLPLQLRLYGEVPVVLTSVMVAGERPVLQAKLYLREAEQALEQWQQQQAEAVAAPAAAVAGGAEAGAAKVVGVPWDSMLND